MDTISKDLTTPAPWTLLFADDVVLNDTNRASLEARAQDWNDRLQEYGLRLNVAKTVYLE